ncbi:hypothetical protein GALL_427890 [mine drainage metagenome]|uniref:Uncharacterized protein n=1 Tax=mine drainage metagenome TaxID=410659 RepID=A0A1J5QHS2_9ZZZZ
MPNLRHFVRADGSTYRFQNQCHPAPQINPGPVVSSILTVWYKSHLAQGVAPDAMMEELKSQKPRLN